MRIDNDKDNMCKSLFFIASIFCTFFITACGSDGRRADEQSRIDDKGVNCPDVEYYEDPLVKIVSVIDGTNDDRLVQVTLSELTIDQSAHSFNTLDFYIMERVDIAADGESAVCTIPCGLFTFGAPYSMVVRAPAFEPKRIEFEPSYKSDGGPPCHSEYSGSYELSIVLDSKG